MDRLIRFRSGMLLLWLVSLCAGPAASFERHDAVVRGKLRRTKTADGVAWRYYVVDPKNKRRYEISQSSTVELANYLDKHVRIDGRHRFSSLSGEHRLFPLKIRPDRVAGGTSPSGTSPSGTSPSGTSPSGSAGTGDATMSQNSEVPGAATLLKVAEDDLPSFIQVGHQAGAQGAEGELPVPPDATLVDPHLFPPVGDQCATCGAHGCGIPHRLWVSGDYVVWWLSGAATPPLVTTSPAGTSRADAGVLGRAGTTVLFGQTDLFDTDRNGARVNFGLWLDQYNSIGVEGEVLGLEDQTQGFSAASNGTTILAQPFFNAAAGVQDANLVAFPAVIAGSINIEATSTFSAAAARIRKNIFCSMGGQCVGCADSPEGMRVDVLGGYRYINLDETLRIREMTTSLITAMPAQFDISDTFDTQNEFHGGELGISVEYRRRLWWLEFATKMALGNNKRKVQINGNTTLATGGIAIPMTGGILAQRTNIGSYSSDKFLIVPEIGIKFGVQLAPRLSVTTGYNFMYLSNVVRPGDQIDTVINPNLFPPEVSPLPGPLRPQFVLQEADLWAQGLSLGLHYIW